MIHHQHGKCYFSQTACEPIKDKLDKPERQQDILQLPQCEPTSRNSPSSQYSIRYKKPVQKLPSLLLLLIAEILNHLGSIKPCKYWDQLPINWCRISSINSSTNLLKSVRYSSQEKKTYKPQSPIPTEIHQRLPQLCLEIHLQNLSQKFIHSKRILWKSNIHFISLHTLISM